MKGKILLYLSVLFVVFFFINVDCFRASELENDTSNVISSDDLNSLSNQNTESYERNAVIDISEGKNEEQYDIGDIIADGSLCDNAFDRKTVLKAATKSILQMNGTENVITLTDFSGENTSLVGEKTTQLYYDSDTILIIEGNNNLPISSDFGIYCAGKLTISGNGTLSISNSKKGIYCKKGLVINDATLNVDGSTKNNEQITNCSIESDNGDIVFDSADINADGNIVTTYKGSLRINNTKIIANSLDPIYEDGAVVDSELNVFRLDGFSVLRNSEIVIGERPIINNFSWIDGVESVENCEITFAGQNFGITATNDCELNNVVIKGVESSRAMFESSKKLEINGGTIDLSGELWGVRVGKLIINSGNVSIRSTAGINSGYGQAAIVDELFEINGGSVSINSSVHGIVISQGEVRLNSGTVSMDNVNYGIDGGDIYSERGILEINSTQHALGVDATIKNVGVCNVYAGSSKRNAKKIDASEYEGEEYLRICAKAVVTTAPRAKTDLVYTGLPQELITPGTADTTMEYSLDGVNYSELIPQGTAAKEYEIYYRAAGNYDCEAGDPTKLKSVIRKAPLEITAKDKTIIYGNTPASGGVEYDGFVNNENEDNLGGTLSYEYNYNLFDAVGDDYSITPKGLTSDNYQISFINGTLKVEKKEIGLAWSSDTLSYNGTAQAPEVTATGLVNSDKVKVTVAGAHTDAGTCYTATAVALTGAKSGNYKIPLANTYTFEISKAESSITLEPNKVNYSKAYGEESFDLLGISVEPAGSKLKYVVSDSKNVSGTTVENDKVIKVLTTGKVEIIGTGSAKISVSIPETQNYTASTVKNIIVTVAKATNPSIVENSANVIKGGKDVNLSENVRNVVGTVSYTIENDNAGGCRVDSNTGIFTSGTSTGTCNVKVTIADSDNYTGKEAIITVNVVDKGLGTLTVTQDGCTYGEGLANPAYRITGQTMLLNGGSYSYVGTMRKGGTYGPSSMKPSEAGTYYVSVSYETDTMIYSGTSQQFVIAPKNIRGAVVTLGPGLIYNGNEQEQGISSVNVGGKSLVNSDYALSNNRGKNAGKYTLKITASDLSNYTGTVTSDFNVAKKPVTAKVYVDSSTEYVYNGRAQEPEFTVIENGTSTDLALSDYTATYSNNINAGIGKVIVSEASKGNYSFSRVIGEFEIKKAEHRDITISKTVIYGKDSYINLSEFIEESGQLGSPIVLEDNDSILSEAPSANGKTLKILTKDYDNSDDKTVKIQVPVERAANYKTYNITVNVTAHKKHIQNLAFAKNEVIIKATDSYSNELIGAKTAVSYKSSDNKVATVDSVGKVTAVDKGEATITAIAAETEDYYSAEASFKIIVDQSRLYKVPFTSSGEKYAAPEDNFAAETNSEKINKQVLDFSRVRESDVKPSDLKMTVINGSKFTTKGKVKDKNSVSTTGGVKVKIGKDMIPKITCKKDGSATFTMEDGSVFTVDFKVQKPKAQKSAKSMSKGDSQVSRSIKDLFGTDIDAGELKILNQKHSQATVSDNTLIIDPKEKDSIKAQYKYLNMKYKITVKVK